MRVLAWPFDKEKDNNPYQWLLYRHFAELGVDVEQYTRARLAFRRYDVVHIHWPERYLNEPQWLRAIGYTLIQLILLRLARWRGAKLVWTVHNLAAHEARYPRFESWFWRRLCRLVDAYIGLSEPAQQAALARHSDLAGKPSFVIPHGHYKQAYANRMSREQAREQLGLSCQQRVVLALGAIRPYKNLPALVNAFRALNDPDAVLLIAGRAGDPAAADALTQQAASDSRVQLRLGHVADDSLQVYFNACDLVAIPYAQVLNSGSALLALSFARPLLLPDQPSLRDLVPRVGTQWLRLYTPPLSTSLLREALDWAGVQRPVPPDLAWADWPRLAEQTIAAYCRIPGVGR